MTIKRLLASTLIQSHLDYVHHILHCRSGLKKKFYGQDASYANNITYLLGQNSP